MSSLLDKHFRHLMTYDVEFLWEWMSLAEKERKHHQDTLNVLDMRRKRLDSGETSCREYHLDVSAQTARRLAVLAEKDFPVPAADWLRSVHDVAQMRRLHRCGGVFLRRFMAECTVTPVRLYGGIKEQSRIQAKLGLCRIRQTLPDLWDVVRYRVVVEGLDTLLSVSLSLAEKAGDQLVRCRNYYFRARGGVDDPYRAIHFVLVFPELGYVEVQIMTAWREALCLIDHSLVYKKSIPYLGGRHRRWLRDLSYTANCVEAGLEDVYPRTMRASASDTPCPGSEAWALGYLPLVGTS
jgi:hypothetical protein